MTGRIRCSATLQTDLGLMLCPLDAVGAIAATGRIQGDVIPYDLAFPLCEAHYQQAQRWAARGGR